MGGGGVGGGLGGWGVIKNQIGHHFIKMLFF